MAAVVFFVSATIFLFSLLYLIKVYEPMWIGIVLCLISLVGMIIITPCIIDADLQEYHSTHIDLIQPEFEYCPYCGVEIE